MEELKVNIDGKDFSVKIEESDNKLKVHLEGKVYTVETSLKNEQKDYELSSSSSDSTKSGVIKSSMPGIIFSVDVKVGEEVKKAQKLVTLIAMKLQNQVLSPVDGKVKEIKIKKDDRVNKGDVLLVVE